MQVFTAADSTIHTPLSAAQIYEFRDEQHKEEFKRRLADRISKTMANDDDFRMEAIMEGRIGLNEMSDKELINFAADCWEIYP